MNSFKTNLSFFIIFLILIACDNGADPEIIESRFPESHDLRDQNILTSVKDQGDYGTCWSFASSAMLETLIKRDLNEDVNLSEQFLINSTEMGPFNAMEFFVNTGTILEDKLLYQGDPVQGFSYDSEVDYRLGSYSVIQLNSLSPRERIDTIKSFLYNNIPVLSHMSSFRDFFRYTGGVYQYDGFSSASAGHIILIIGWKDDSAYPFGGYWIVKNSFGANWGENGYFRVTYEDTDFANQYAIVGENPIKVQ